MGSASDAAFGDQLCGNGRVALRGRALARRYRRPGIPGQPEDLRQHRLITRRFLGGRVSPWNFTAQDGSITTLDTDAAVMTLSSPETITQLAVAGFGIAQIGVHHAWRHLQAGTLKVLLPASHHPGNFEMTLQYPHRALLAPRVRVTVEYLLEAFAQCEELHVPLAVLTQFVA